PCQILELAAPFEPVTGRNLYLTRNRLLRLGDIATDVAVVHVDVEVVHELRVFGADHRGALDGLHLRHLPERDGWSFCGLDAHPRGDCLGIGPQAAQIPDIDGVSLAAFYGGRDRLTAECGRDRLLPVAYGEAIARECPPIGGVLG